MSNADAVVYYDALLAKVRRRCESTGQSHLLDHLPPSSPSDDGDDAPSFREALALLESIDAMPLESLSSYLAGALDEEARLGDVDPSSSVDDDDGGMRITPFVGESTSTATSDPVQLGLMEKSRKIGMDAISCGSVAAVLLAGGQGTRLGYDGPKGMYDIGLPSHMTLFRYMSDRIKKLGMLSGGHARSIPFYVMTSPLNHDATTEYFKDNDDFGLDVKFFPQGTLPALTIDGKMILESRTSLSVAPDGNGGIYPALVKHGILDDMKNRGIKYIHVFGVDNALVKPADPTFVGYCIMRDADCGNKVLWKASPDEKVGVVASRGGRPCIVEYSDMSREMSEARGDDGRLTYGAGNICNHFYTLDFVENVIVPNVGSMYHVARKKIPYYDANTDTTITPPSNNGIKLESFIFDVFPLSTNMAILDVRRELEFAPVKNPPGSDSDSPDTARRLFSDVAKGWMRDAGAILVGDLDSDLCEVRPMTSYDGEGLEGWMGKEVVCPFSI
jgi:UDP-N-acetylglucosamine/UDP-N-acetylgalactosamine diphosphorylase